jgi:cyanate permease
MRKPILETVVMTLWMGTLPILLSEQQDDRSWWTMCLGASALYIIGLVGMWYVWRSETRPIKDVQAL